MSQVTEDLSHVNKINDYVKISDDEYVIKDYNAAKIKKPTKGEAHVVLTNKRAIIYYWTQKGILVNDAHITEVLGTDIFWAKRRRRKLGIFSFLTGIVFLALSIFMSVFTSAGTSVLLGSLLVVLPLMGGGLYYLFKVRHSFVIIFYIRAVTAALSFANFPTGIMDKALSSERIKLEGKPGVDAEVLAKEIGALILDIQKGISQ